VTKPRAIVLDCGGTLLHPDTALLLAALDQAGIEYPEGVRLDATLSRTGDIARLGLTDIPSEDPFFDIWAFTSGIRDTRAPGVLRQVTHGGRLYTRPDVDALSTVRALRDRGVRVGVLANDDGELRGELEQFGLSDFVDAQVSSHEIGVAKPDPGAFDEVTRRLNVPASSCWYVGDSIVNDYLGSLSAGFGSSIAYDPHGSLSALRIRTISRLSDLLRLVDGLPRGTSRPDEWNEVPL
jgi:FMN phosphatase YigB (HAD superfamily)